MTRAGDQPERPKFVVKMPKSASPPGQLSFVWGAPGPSARRPGTPTNYERRLMTLLNVKSPGDLERVLSEPPDEKALETMGPPYELYDLEWADDVIDSALHEIEHEEDEGTDALFVTQRGLAVHQVVGPAPRRLRKVVCPSLVDKSLGPNPLWRMFIRQGRRNQFLIYEEI